MWIVFPFTVYKGEFVCDAVSKHVKQHLRSLGKTYPQWQALSWDEAERLCESGTCPIAVPPMPHALLPGEAVAPAGEKESLLASACGSQSAEKSRQDVLTAS